MINQTCFTTSYKQSDDVCMIVSYGYVIDYYSNLQGLSIQNSFFDELFKHYLNVAMRLLKDGISIDVERTLFHKCLNDNKKRERLSNYISLKEGIITIHDLSGAKLQRYTSNIFHFYCQDYCSFANINNVGIDGSTHLYQFNRELMSINQSTCDSFFPKNFIMERPIINHTNGISMDKIKEFLSVNANSLAIIVYQTKDGRNYHTIVCGQINNAFFIRDPNLTTVSGTTYDGVSVDQIKAVECILIKSVA